MPPTRRRLQALERNTGFRAAWLEKALRLQEVLVAIQNDRRLKGVLALKGGTALNLGYLGLARLSVDLDFNYVRPVDREAMLAERPELEARVERIAVSLGYAMRLLSRGHAATLWSLGYTTAFRGPDALRTEVNYLHRIPLFGVRDVPSLTLDGVSTLTFMAVSPEELVGGKLKALVERAAPRDLFDVYRYALTPIEGLDPMRLRIAFVILTATMVADVREVTPEGVLASVTEQDIRNKLLPTLRRSDPVDRNTMVRVAMPILRDLLGLSFEERAFLDAVMRGRMEPAHLTPDSELQARISQHPALRWKVENISAYVAGERPPRGRRRGRPRHG